MKGNLTLAHHYFHKLILIFSSGLIAMISFAQDKKEIDVNVTSNKTSFWEQPWVWVVGAAVFILLLVGILKSGRKS